MKITERRLRSIIRSVIRESSERLQLQTGNPHSRFPEFIEQYRKDIVRQYMDNHQNPDEPLQWLENNIPRLESNYDQNTISVMKDKLYDVYNKFINSPTYLNQNG